LGILLGDLKRIPNCNESKDEQGHLKSKSMADLTSGRHQSTTTRNWPWNHVKLGGLTVWLKSVQALLVIPCSPLPAGSSMVHGLKGNCGTTASYQPSRATNRPLFDMDLVAFQQDDHIPPASL